MTRSVRLTVNGQTREGAAEPRLSLADFLREGLGLTGTHVGCEHGVCGACTVLLDGGAHPRLLMLAVQADGRSITTVEGLRRRRTSCSPLQQAFQDKHGLQCGYCTPGILLTAQACSRARTRPHARGDRQMLAGNLCRCTGYHHIVEAIEAAAPWARPGPHAPKPA